MTASFTKGDLVKIVEGVHQEEMPKHRMGIIIGNSAHEGHDYYPDVYDVLFLGNTEPMRFHKMYIEYVEKD